ncbi:DMT family transporter [Chryseosolibacter indicus]|uniref:DMT family transporter n=1 Tax=Chryseosolibacter indicus TaxID=2782351 RepID=A0ABS5VKL4_9BACT|nr:DMT family transporter [Chryseosolibacter indicus]MBT1701983.1 DMT family transporter [Chryseosolibacter indicus]
MPETKNGKFSSVFLVVILTLIWGTSFILMKRGLKVYSAGEVGAIRVVSASIFLLPFALTRIKELNKDHYWKLLLSGLLGVFFPAFLFATAQTKMDSAITGILNSLTPIFTMIISAIVFKQVFKKQALVGIIIGLAGSILLIISRTGGQIGGINLYAIFVIIACICYGSNVNFIKFKLPDLKALTITSLSLMLIAPLALIYLFAFTPFTTKLSAHPGAVEALGFLILLGLMSTSIATILFNRLIKISTPLFASSITYLIPIVAVIWGLLDGEQLAMGHFIGMIAIIGGVYIANKK